MQPTEDSIVPKYQKPRLRTVGGVAFGATPIILRFFVHSSAAKGQLQSNEFGPRWVLTTKFHENRSTGSG